MKRFEKKIESRNKRKMHIRKNLSGTAEKPRLTVYRSSRYIYAQLIDDVNSKTLVSASDTRITSKVAPVEKAKLVGQAIASLALKKDITKIVFDRNGFKYHGRVKSLAEALRESGLIF